MNRCEAEISEIERHKYFLSEENGHDVGWEFAEQDWEEKFGEQFRSHSDPSASASETATSTTIQIETRSSDASDQPVSTQNSDWFKTLLRKLFHST